jgi:hypothetical protein
MSISGALKSDERSRLGRRVQGDVALQRENVAVGDRSVCEPPRFCVLEELHVLRR